jgi:hypothetical protein
MNYNHPQFRHMAGRLAELFDSEEGERILRLITRLSGSGDGRGSLTEEKPVDKPEKLRVGVWEATNEGTKRSFVRVNTGDPMNFWAGVQKIPPKGSRRRVVLVGESVARGYFYDPHFTAAEALQKMMDATCGPDKIEVVDLAATNLVHEQLQELIGQALHLEPDALVIFAGNNWCAPWFDERLLEVSSRFRETDSWRGVKEVCESVLIAKSRQTLSLLEEIIQERRIPVVFMLPEFNLADWITESDCPPLLDSEENEEWLRAKSEAEQLLQGNDWEKAQHLGERLLELDQGTTPAGPNVLAAVSQKRGDRQTTRTFLEMARDAVVSMPYHNTPRCYSVIQQTIREAAAAHGIHLVDLPREFTNYTGGEIPNRRLLIDYCHLTLEGIRFSMALAAETLLPLLNYPSKSSKELAQVDMEVDGEVNAGAHFLAAVVTGNAGQRIDVIRHHIRTSLAYDRGIARMMQLFLDFHIRNAPTSLCRSFEQLCELPNTTAIIAFYNDSMRNKFLNTKLITAISEELEAVGIPVRSHIERLLIREHGIKNRTVNLVKNLYSTSSWPRKVVDIRPEFYKATTRNTNLVLVCDKPEPLKFAITMKVPAVKSDQTISLRLNGNLVAEFPATDRWATSTCSAPAGLVHSGLNQVEISWPMALWSGEKQRARVADCFEAGEMVEITPMFGLVHSLRVSREGSA